MKKIIFVFLMLYAVSLYPKNRDIDYDLNKDFYILNKYDNITTSDDITFTFYLEFKYKFTRKGKKGYRKIIKGLKRDIDKLSKEKIKDEIDKVSNTVSVQLAENLLNTIYPPEHFISFSVDYALNEIIKDYDSDTIENYIKSYNNGFYNTIAEKVKKTVKENRLGTITSIKFLTVSEYRQKVAK